ncbi:MAG: aromatic ring-hydroxylating dioxygenase subunit alpha [Bradyrhizobium sp.]|uniref:aromatic ring-hydroxylating oxygenase subunit alpha n=1 Tax=Bradyrhizobium sp. TaxID=376 RepID=UPI003D133A87
MQQSVQIELARRAFAHLDAGTTDLAADVYRHPVDTYVDRGWLAREKATLFRRYPLFVGLSGRIAQPGDYFAEEHAGMPVLVVRGDDGAARAFVNLCRHRGAPVGKGCGRVDGFSCPYHAWRYDRQGHLVAIPDQRSFPGVDRSAHGLVPLPLVERDGILWVQPAPDVRLDDAALTAHLCGMEQDLASYRLVDYRLFESRVLKRETNWKMPIETFLEPYHFMPLHRDTVAPIFHANLCLFDAFGLNQREAVLRRTFHTLRDQPESTWDFVRHSAISYQIFPNTVFVMQADHVETWRVFPDEDGPDRCVVHFDCYVPELPATDKARRYWEANVDLAIRTVDLEDIAMQVELARGFRSGVAENVLVGRNEPSLAHYQRAIRRAVTGVAA